MRDYLHAAFSVHSRRSHIGQDFLNPLSLLHSINQLTLFLRQQLPFPATKPMVFWIALVPCREKDWLLSDFASRLVYLKTSPALTGIELSQLDLVPKGRKEGSFGETIWNWFQRSLPLSYCQFRKMEGLL